MKNYFNFIFSKMGGEENRKIFGLFQGESNRRYGQRGY
jgi:hypothetical protein